MKKKRRSRAISVVRLLREQQDIYEGMLREARREVQEIRGVHDNILTRLETLDLKYPDLIDIGEDLSYLHKFCAQFWAKEEPKESSDPYAEVQLPKSAIEILPNVPAEKRSKFWQFVERLMGLLAKGRRG